MNAYQDGWGARLGIGEYLRFYNTQWPNQTLDYRNLAEVLISGPEEIVPGDVVESPGVSVPTVNPAAAGGSLPISRHSYPFVGIHLTDRDQSASLTHLGGRTSQ